MQTVPVYEWQQGGDIIGCGTQVEFDYWRSEGTIDDAATLGKVLCHEPASMDEKRKRAWEALA